MSKALHKKQLFDLIAQFEKDKLTGQQAEHVLFSVLAGCGFPTRRNFRLGNKEVDGDFVAVLNGFEQKVVVEIKSTARPEIISRTIDQVVAIKRIGKYDRALILVKGGITDRIVKHAVSVGLGYVDLLGPSELRSWVVKHVLPSPDEEKPCALIIREAMRGIAVRLANYPEELKSIEWRDLERVLREVFEGIGFDTTLTRSGKDGGFDLELVTESKNGRQVYLVEVKHWINQKPGRNELKKLIRVTAREAASRGLLLSTSGFGSKIYQGITEADLKTVRLGDGEKIRALCRSYYRLGTELWMPSPELSEQLFEGTR